MTIIKPLSTEISIATANTVSNAYLVLVTNTGAATTLTVANGVTTVANLTMLANSTMIIEKQFDQTVQGTGLLAVPVAYKG